MMVIIKQLSKYRRRLIFVSASSLSAVPDPDAIPAWVRGRLQDGGVRDSAQIAASLRELIRLSVRFERQVGDALAVNRTDLAAMEHLMESGELTPTELADRLGISTAAVTLVLDRLEALGHVQRRPHRTDRRKLSVVPSPTSVAHAVTELLPVITGVSAVVQEMSSADRVVVERFLNGVLEVYRGSLLE